MDNPGTGIPRGPGSIALHTPASIDDPDDTEFERRFLVSDEGVLSRASGVTTIIQGYLWASNGYAVRVRLSQPEAPDYCHVDPQGAPDRIPPLRD